MTSSSAVPVSPFEGLDEAEETFNVYGDPADPAIVSDEESNEEDDRLDESFATRLQKAAAEREEIVDDEDNNDDDHDDDSATTNDSNASSSNYKTENTNLLGILEVSKFFIHDSPNGHDAEIECGVASGLITLLSRSLFLYEQGRGNNENKQSSEYAVSGLQYIATLSTSLAMVLHCSRSVLEEHIRKFDSNLIPALQSIVDNFAAPDCECDIILVQVVLTNLCRVIGLVHSVLPDQIEPLMQILLSLVRGADVSTQIKVQAAGTVCSVVENYPLNINPNVGAMLEEHASALISIVSTASVPLAEDDNLNDTTLRLYDLAAISHSIRAKIMKRRCAVLSITRHLQHSEPEVRRKAYSFCQDFFDRPETLDKCSSGMFVENSLVEALAEAAPSETDPDLQHLVSKLLHTITEVQAFPSSAVMAVIRHFAYNGQSDDVVVKCASAYCEGMRREPFPTLESLSTVVDFTTFPFSKIRATAFSTLETLLTKSESVNSLLEETEMLENFGLVVSHGEDDDCEAALNTMRQLSRSSRNHPKICRSSAFLGALIDFVVKGDVTNRSAHFYGVEIVLALLSNDENTSLILPFRSLLPWLVNFLNRTTADESFKEQLVAVILRLSTAYLQQEE